MSSPAGSRAGSPTGSSTRGLLDRTVGFAQALRRAGLPVSVAEVLDAARALAVVDLLDREQLRAGFAAATVKRAAHRPAFDALFDLWFPPLLGAPAPVSDGASENGAEGPTSEDPRSQRDALRDELTELLLDGDLAALQRFARQAVDRLGRADAPPGRQQFFAYKVLRDLSPDTLMAALLDALLGDRPRGGLDEAVARQTIRERIRAFEQAVDAEVRRRVAEERGVEQVAKTAVKPLLDQVEFLRAQRQDLEALRRQVHPLARRLATRLAARRRLGREGRLDFRRTVRASLATGGVPVVTHHRPRRPHKPELVVLCDVSGSVSSFAHFTLLLSYALQEQFTKVRAFAFIDTCDEVTPYFEQGADLPDALERMNRGARLVWFDGHSDYGHSFEVFEERFADAVTPRTSLLVLGDARNNYRALGLPSLRRVVAEARHAYWLNPEPRRQWGSGDSAADHYAEVLEMVECRNVAQLTEFVERVLPG